MDKGEKAYMANKLFKDDLVVAAKVKEFIPDEILTPKVTVTYKAGDRFRVSDSTYLLAQVQPSSVCLVCLEEGNRWVEAIVVGDTKKVTESEMKEISNGTSYHKVGA